MSALENLNNLGLEISPPASAAANYLPTKKSGNIIYISGQLSSTKDGIITGILGENMNIEEGQRAASSCALAILSQIKYDANIDLDKIKSILKLTILVASTPNFTSQHLVANGASDLLVAVLGNKGKHARAAFGVASLPLGAAVEIEAIIEI